jgi:hypothetical protein
MPSDNKRPSIEGHHLETPGAHLEKGGVLAENGDYSGAVAKTSPEEIRLVRKLDFRIMPTLWAMYFLNYVRTPVLEHHELPLLTVDTIAGP